jgi:hypothetical protein
MHFLFTDVSTNAKTGPLPVVMVSNHTCPSTCKMLGNGCYAESGPTAIHWSKLSSGQNPRALDLDQLTHRIRAMPRGQLWRYGTAGDLPPDHAAVRQLAAATAARPVIAYTHRRGDDWFAMLRSVAPQMHVNLSADSVDEADALAETGLSVVVVLRSDQTEGPYFTPAGRKIAVCPATKVNPKTGASLTTCARCKVCSKPRTGGVIIGFPAHGARRKVVDRRLNA